MSTWLCHEIPRNLVKYYFWQVCESVLDEISVLVGRLCVRAQLLGLVWLFVAPQTVAHHAPLSTEFFRQEYESGLLFPTPEDISNPGIDTSLVSPTLASGFFTTWEA